MNRYFTIVFCGVMLALNAVSCDMLITGFFAMRADLGTSIERVQALIPVYLMAVAVGQLVFGPASDKYGRKPVLTVGLAIYIAGSIAAMVSTSIGVLWLARFLQGFGASCGIVLARAILRDTHSGAELARAMALAMAIFAIGPLLAPLIGAGLMALGDWRTAFLGLTIFGFALLAVTRFIYRESNLNPNPNALEFASLRDAAGAVLSHPQSRRYLIACMILQTIVLCFLVNMPLLYKNAFGVEGTRLAVLFACAAIGIVIGQLISNKMIAMVGVVQTFRGATVLFAFAIFLMWFLSRSAAPSLVVFTVLFFLFNVCFLVVFSNGASLVLEPHRNIAGVASALFGSLTQLVGAVLSILLMPVIKGQLSMWATVQLVLVMLIIAVAWGSPQRFLADAQKKP